MMTATDAEIDAWVLEFLKHGQAQFFLDIDKAAQAKFGPDGLLTRYVAESLGRLQGRGLVEKVGGRDRYELA